MPKIVTPLSQTVINNAKPKDKDYYLGDGNGLSLLIKANGSKLWHFVYTHPTINKKVKLSMGHYPDISLAKARKKRNAAELLLEDKKDPKTHRDETRKEQRVALDNTLHFVFKKWFPIKVSEVQAGTANRIEARFNNHILPALGKTPIKDITAPQTINLITQVAVKDNLDLARKLCSEINQLMNFAKDSGMIEINRLSGIRNAFLKAKIVNRPSLTPPEFPTLLNAMSNAELPLITHYLLEFQLHTLTRPIEAVGAKWSEFDITQKNWTIPAERMKRKIPHTVPLTDQTVALLQLIQKTSLSGEYLFPSPMKNKTHRCAATANIALRSMGLKDKQSAHGLRALGSTTLNEQGYDSDLIEAALSHTEESKSTKRNEQHDLEQRRKLMQCWSRYIEETQSNNS